MRNDLIGAKGYKLMVQVSNKKRYKEMNALNAFFSFSYLFTLSIIFFVFH